MVMIVNQCCENIRTQSECIQWKCRKWKIREIHNLSPDLLHKADKTWTTQERVMKFGPNMSQTPKLKVKGDGVSVAAVEKGY